MIDRNRKRVGIALGGGVVRGFAHLGVLAALEEAGIPVDYMAGSSAGAFVGATYCSGADLKTIMERAMRLKWWDLAWPVFPRRGFVSLDRLSRWLENQLGEIEFKDLKIPYAVAATDLRTGRAVTLCEGRLAPAVQASCSVPGAITPVELNGMILGDGSISNTIPVSTLREMGADYVIGVDIFASSIRRYWGPFGMGFAALEILVQRAGGGMDEADCIIAPEIGGKTYLRFSKREEFYALGKAAAMAKVAEIRAALS